MEIRNRTPFTFGFLTGRVNHPAHTATLVVKAAFRMVDGGICEPLPAQPALEGDVLSATERPEALYDADLALFKPRTDVLLAGACHTPGGKPLPVCGVKFAVGGWSKALACIGNRGWQRSLLSARMTEPQPFTRVDITWAHALGGPGFEANPAGKGVDDDLLPNIELPGHLIGGRRDRPQPAGFGPIHRTWKLRRGKQGTCDNRWLKERWPAQPRDFDWTYFNAAPEDQQIEGFLRGDEEVVLENLRPEQPLFRTRLPGLRVRVLLREGDDLRLREAPMNLDTLFVDAHKAEITLLWRGVVNIAGTDWDEARDILIVSEALGSSAAPAQALLPLLEEPAEPAEEPEEAGMDPAAEKAALEADFAKADKLAEQAEAQAATEAAAAGLKLPAGAPPAPKFEQLVAELSQALAQAKAEGLKVPATSGANLSSLLDDDVAEALRAAAAPAKAAPQSLAAIARSGEGKGGDFSGADLSNQDLSGADLREAYLNGAKLRGARLSCARLGDAVLSGADLSGADLTGADLSGADLTGASLEHAVLKNAVLDNAVLSGVKAAKADFSGAQGSEAICTGLKAPGAVFAGGKWPAAVFAEADLAGADFSKAELPDAALDGAAAKGAKFAGALLTGLRGSDGADFSEAAFAGVQAEGAVFERSRLLGADFAGADLRRAQFPGSDLTGARFFGADLSEANLRRAVLAGAKGGNANFLRALLEQTDLRGGQFQASNFYEAEFLDANTQGADFAGANLKATKLAGK